MIGSSKIGLRPIRGGGGTAANPDFVFEVDTTQSGSASDTFVLPLSSGGTYAFNIDWGDGNDDDIAVYNQSEITHQYAASGTYTCTISGVIEGWQFNGTGDRLKLIDISNWGTFNISTSSVFKSCANLDVSATDSPTVTTTSFLSLFHGCVSLTTPDFNSWDVSTVTYMHSCFYQATNFNGLIDQWDMSNVTNARQMLKQANAFNGPVGSWDVSAMTDMVFILSTIPSFNQDLGGWRPGSPNMFKAVENCDAFRGGFAGWTVENITSLSSIMINATGMSTANYDATLIAWDTQGPMTYSGNVNFGGSKYTSGGAAESARTSLVAKFGSITDGGPA